MRSTEEIRAVLTAITYRDWIFHLHEDHGLHWLQLRFKDGGESQHCRKWLISRHSTESEIVQTALKAVLAAEEHEARERFRFFGKAVFGPHISVRALLDVCDRISVRSTPANVKEVLS